MALHKSLRSKSSAKLVLPTHYTNGNVAQVASKLSRRFKSGTVLQLSPDSATILSDNHTQIVRKRR